MPHHYDNFDEAYTALRNKYAIAVTQFWAANDYGLMAKAHWQAGDDHACLWDLMVQVSYIMGYDNSIWTYSYNNVYRSVAAESIYWAAQQGEAAEVDMAAILAAMLAATQPELTSFVGIADAYRQSIWNQPFNQEYYAALARGFTTWE